MDKERDAHRDRERYEGMTERLTEIDREGGKSIEYWKRKGKEGNLD